MKVLAADGVSPKGIEILKQAGIECVVKDKLPADELLEIIPEFDGLIVRSASTVTKEVIARAENLKIIGRAGVGTDNIDIAAATARGIIVVNSPGGNTIAATEHTMGMMLAMARNIAPANETLQQGEWNRKQYTGVELRGKTLGVIGLGRIGSGVATRAVAFGMNIIGYDPFVNQERANSLGIKVVSLDELIRESDFITVHMPLTNKTKNLINKDNIAHMKAGVRIINCARGGIINEQDLAEAVQAGKIAGAAIDVFEAEPIPADHPLIGIKNITLTPHLGASTIEAQIGVSVDVAKSIVSAFNNEPVATAVNLAPVSSQAMKVIRPYLNLAERLGTTACSLANGPISEVTIRYNGEIAEVDTKMLTIAIIKGMLTPIMEDNVNYVNAPSLAQERNIKIQEIKEAECVNFANLITVYVTANNKQQIVQGTLFGDEGRIVSINGHRMDIDPRERMLILPHINRPGVIGNIGSILGENGVNISAMQVGKTTVAGISMMVLTIDNDISDEVIAQILALEEIADAKLVNFEQS